MELSWEYISCRNEILGKISEVVVLLGMAKSRIQALEAIAKVKWIKRGDYRIQRHQYYKDHSYKC